MLRSQIETHHEEELAALPVITCHIRRVAALHRARDPQLDLVSRVFERVAEELSEHIGRHTAIPGGPEDREPLEVEHTSLLMAMNTVRELMSGYAPPPHACAMYRLLCQELKAFDAELRAHVSFERQLMARPAATPSAFAGA